MMTWKTLSTLYLMPTTRTKVRPLKPVRSQTWSTMPWNRWEKEEPSQIKKSNNSSMQLTRTVTERSPNQNSSKSSRKSSVQNDWEHQKKVMISIPIMKLIFSLKSIKKRQILKFQRSVCQSYLFVNSSRFLLYLRGFEIFLKKNLFN